MTQVADFGDAAFRVGLGDKSDEIIRIVRDNVAIVIRKERVPGAEAGCPFV